MKNKLAPRGRTQARLAWDGEFPAETGADHGNGLTLHDSAEITDKQPTQRVLKWMLVCITSFFRPVWTVTES